MKKKLIMAVMAVLMIVPSFCYANIGNDKAAHIGASTAAGIVLAQNKPFIKWKPWQSVLFNAVVIGGAKEWYDSRHPDNHSADWGDIGADAVGALGAEGMIWIVHKSF